MDKKVSSNHVLFVTGLVTIAPFLVKKKKFPLRKDVFTKLIKIGSVVLEKERF